jgi:hypothetical protein
MRGFNDARFANSFGRIHSAVNPGLKKHHWEAVGVKWLRERHGYHGPHYSFQCETFLLTRLASKNSWTLLVVSETWWNEDGNAVLRSNHWGKLLTGRKPDALAWFKTQEDALQSGEKVRRT